METKNHNSIRSLLYATCAVIFFTLLINLNTFAQRVDNNAITNEVSQPVYKIEKFSSKQVAKKIYLNWTAVSTEDNCFFVIERSNNGIDYKSIGMKKGAKSPNNIPLLFSFTDEEPLAVNSYYRVYLLTSNGQIVASIFGEIVYSYSEVINQRLY